VLWVSYVRGVCVCLHVRGVCVSGVDVCMCVCVCVCVCLCVCVEVCLGSISGADSRWQGAHP
jgi:hypothetical protein